jgi:hypothetical protein
MMENKLGYRAGRIRPPRGSAFGVRFMYLNHEHQLLGKWQEPWPLGTNTARCLREPNTIGHPQKVPYRDCLSGCGIWASWKGWMQDPPPEAPQVVCLVEGFGKLLAGDLGWCAESAVLVAVSPAYYERDWPPPRGDSWLLSSDTRSWVPGQRLCTDLDLNGLGEAASRHYQVPLKGRKDLSDMAKALNADWHTDS